MYTLKDKNYFEQLNNSNPEICNHVKALFESTKEDIRIGCHDIVNAVSLIHGYAQLYASANPEITNNSKWKDVSDSIQYLIKLMSDISTYRYSDVLTLSPGSIDSTIRKIISDYSGKSSLMIDLDIPDSLPDIVFNADAVKYIIHSLLDNISDINPAAQVDITANFDTDHIYITVSDSLGGLSEEIMSKLFHPFLNGKEFHSGLSLATSYRMMMAHNGSLSYKPSDSGGSSFVLTFKTQNSHQTF